MNSASEDNSMDGYCSDSDSMFDSGSDYEDNDNSSVNSEGETNNNVEDMKRDYEVDYKCLSAGDLRDLQDEYIKKVSGICGVSCQDAATLLRQFQWKEDDVLDYCMTEKKKTLMGDNVKQDESETDFRCGICLEDSVPLTDKVYATCIHGYCSSCFKEYVRLKIRDEGECQRLRCPHPKCDVVVDEKMVKELVDDETYQRYRAFLDDAFFDDISSLKWCPKGNCGHAIECEVPKVSLDTIVPTVQCKCGMTFCFGCDVEEDHQPALCKTAAAWIKKANDDSETKKWLQAFTKACPKCSSTIEKSGGCNHMTCKKCKYEFCWVCEGEWKKHGESWYKCNFFDKNAAEGLDQQAQSEAEIKRYHHFFSRYANHEHSAKLQTKLYEQTELKMNEIQQDGLLTWVDARFLKEAVDVAVRCRMTLKWTYVFAYYLAENNSTQLFIDNQADLEKATEAISELLEKPIYKSDISELRDKIRAKTAYVKKRHEILLEDVLIGHISDRWEYRAHI